MAIEDSNKEDKKYNWWHDTDEGQAYRKTLSDIKKEYWSSEEGEKAKDDLKKKLKDFYSSDEARKKKSDTMKEWYMSSEGEEYRELQKKRYNWGELKFVRTKEWYQTEEGQKSIENKKAWFKTPEGIAHKEKLREKCSGKNNHLYQAFVIEAVTPKGESLSYRFDRDTPNADAHKELGIGYKKLTELKKGDTWVIPGRSIRTRHPWPKFTSITMTLI